MGSNRWDRATMLTLHMRHRRGERETTVLTKRGYNRLNGSLAIWTEQIARTVTAYAVAGKKQIEQAIEIVYHLQVFLLPPRLFIHREHDYTRFYAVQSISRDRMSFLGEGFFREVKERSFECSSGSSSDLSFRRTVVRS